MRTRRRLRLGGFDYSSVGLYLVTICASERRCVLGTVDGESVVLSRRGQIVERHIELVSTRVPEVEIDAHVVMPNHVHAIVALTRARQASPLRLGDVVGGLKSGSAREINLLRGTPGAAVWQRGYHDHIIRDQSDLMRVREYIESNPIRWALDPENPARRS